MQISIYQILSIKYCNAKNLCKTLDHFLILSFINSLCKCSPKSNMSLGHMFRDLYVLWESQATSNRIFYVCTCASLWERVSLFLFDISWIEDKCKYLIKICAERHRWSVRLGDCACLHFAAALPAFLCYVALGGMKDVRYYGWRGRPVGLIDVISQEELVKL